MSGLPTCGSDTLHRKIIEKDTLFLVLSSFYHSQLKWCPSPDCSFAVKTACRVTEPRLVNCKCGAKFCVCCGEEWHEPSTCFALRQWLRKGERDGPTLQWIASNTKECPKCHVPIEKDGGCNHVLCKSPSCRYDFCWVCLGPWESHGSSWYSCNRLGFNSRCLRKSSRADPVRRGGAS
jgi:hypothetical protein